MNRIIKLTHTWYDISRLITIQGIDDLETVTVHGEVIGMEEPMQVGSGIMKQDVYIADAKTTVTLTLCMGR